METEYKGREWIEKVYLPNLYGSVLLVGINQATKDYPKLVNEPDKCVTVDNNIGNAKFGSPAIHIIADFLVIDKRKYRNVSVYGLDPKYTPSDEESWLEWAKKLLVKADSLLEDGGTLLFGGYMGEGWEKLRLLRELSDYEELYFLAEEINGKTCVKWWIKKNE